MVIVNFSELLDALAFSSFSGPLDSGAFVNLQTGEVHCMSGDPSPDDELPEDLDDESKYLAVPSKTELDLGRRLALGFTQEFLSNEYDTVVNHFRQRGAYGKFSALLERRGVVDAWYKFEAAATELALKQWCLDNGIELG